MTVRKYSYIRIYNILVVIILVFLMITIMPLIIDKDLRFPSLNEKRESKNSEKRENNISATTRDGPKNVKEINLHCQPKTKIGYLKIHKAASRLIISYMAL